MTEFVIMPQADYEAACNAIRTKTGKTDFIKSGQLGQEILSIETGGGTSEDLRYVTFMAHDGAVELGRKAVAVGDDCADPIARGLFGTPTKESTAQYNYSFVGWATAPNGALDNNALKSVADDRVVYAAFAAVTRYYTIRFYDGDELLKTESLAYGTMPNFVIEKDGYNFDGWVPELAAVTGDENYYAQFSEALTFAGASWADIAEISASGQAASTFKVGDTKDVVLTYADGATETISVAIAGFNHDDLASGAGKAGMSVICTTIPTKTTAWCASVGSGNSSNIYNYPPSWNMESYCRVRSLLDGDILNALPSELRSVLKPVTKDVDSSISSGNTPHGVTCKLFPLSLHELGSTLTSNQYRDLGDKYDIFTETFSSFGGSIKALAVKDAAGTAVSYWTRQLYAIGVLAACFVNSSGTVSSARESATTTSLYGVRFGFCI